MNTKKFFTFIIEVFFLEGGNDSTQVLKGRNVAKTFENHWVDPRLRRLDKSTSVRCGPFVPIILHLNVKGLIGNKICIISQLGFRHKALVIFLEKTNCTNAEQLVIPHFAQVGWV